MTPPPYLVQPIAVDIAAWEVDTEFEVFPQGARDKTAVIAPDPAPLDCLLPRRRYLFKQSDKRYVDHFWTEVVAYRVGRLLGLDVPPAFAAYDGRDGTCGALIQWFYTDGIERFVLAGDLLQDIRPGFERKLGDDHNLGDIGKLMLLLRLMRAIRSDEDWRMWWALGIFFDSLIGNTDRHQDNWGFLYVKRDNGANDEARLAPYFDNGTSLGYERFPQRVAGWSGSDLDRYIAKGTHHVRWAHGEAKSGHVQLCQRVLQGWPVNRAELAARLAQVTEEALSAALDDLAQLQLPIPLSNDRRTFMLRLLMRRLAHLQALF